MPAMILRQHSWPNSMASTTLSSTTPDAAGFHHHDAVLGAGHDDGELGFARLVVAGVGDHFAADDADANRAEHVIERNIGNRQRCRRADDGERGRIMLRDRPTAPCR